MPEASLSSMNRGKARTRKRPASTPAVAGEGNVTGFGLPSPAWPDVHVPPAQPALLEAVEAVPRHEHVDVFGCAHDAVHREGEGAGDGVVDPHLAQPAGDVSGGVLQG
jgi:hypothetical protein